MIQQALQVRRVNLFLLISLSLVHTDAECRALNRQSIFQKISHRLELFLAFSHTKFFLYHIDM